MDLLSILCSPVTDLSIFHSHIQLTLCHEPILSLLLPLLLVMDPGATLMAAGGSAPELFTSLIGTFRESEIGFGTIVGSATFNVLFVIGMCSLLAKEVLTLTWWPLFRDSSYYTVGLVILAIFSGVVTPNEIEWWEAVILFAMYIGYILLMWQNANLYKALTGKVLEYPDEDEEDATDPNDQEEAEKATGAEQEMANGTTTNGDKAVDGDPVMAAGLESAGADEQAGGNGDNRGSLRKQPSKASVLSQLSAGNLHSHQAQIGGNSTPHFRWQGTFRAGILKLLKDPDSWLDTAGTGIVAKIAGDADYVFSQVDIDGNGHVDREELKQLFNLLEVYISPQELEDVFGELDADGDGTVSRKLVYKVSRGQWMETNEENSSF
jgi:Ca2+/Na+ antiporter